MIKDKIIIDTDLGDDIDDIFAISMALSCGKFDVRLISVCTFDIEYKLKAAKLMLERNGIDIPLAKGREIGKSNKPHDVSQITLGRYPNAADAIAIEVENGADTIVGLGPCTNLADFVTKYPRLKNKCRIIYLGCSLKYGYINQDAPCADFNVASDAGAFIALSESGFDLTVVPLDVCRDFIIEGENFKKLKVSKNKFAVNYLKFYDEWHKNYFGGAIKYPKETSSGIMYDAVPFIYLMDKSLFKAEKLLIEGDMQGYTRISGKGFPMTALMEYNKEGAIKTALEGLIK